MKDGSTTPFAFSKGNSLVKIRMRDIKRNMVRRTVGFSQDCMPRTRTWDIGAFVKFEVGWVRRYTFGEIYPSQMASDLIPYSLRMMH